jgi:G patch domain-containing protein 1
MDAGLEVPVDTSGLLAHAAGPGFTGTASADEFIGTSEGATQVECRASRSGKRDATNIGLGKDDGQGDDVLTYEHLKMDILK